MRDFLSKGEEERQTNLIIIFQRKALELVREILHNGKKTSLRRDEGGRELSVSRELGVAWEAVQHSLTIGTRPRTYTYRCKCNKMQLDIGRAKAGLGELFQCWPRSSDLYTLYPRVPRVLIESRWSLTRTGHPVLLTLSNNHISSLDNHHRIP